MLLNPIWGMGVAPNKVLFVNLLPAARFMLQTRGGAMTIVEFSLDAGGDVHLAPGLEAFVRLDRFHGLRRLSALTELPQR